VSPPAAGRVPPADPSPGTAPPPRAAPPPLLALRGIGKRYGTTIANAGIDLEVAEGEIHAVLGENGAGKSTLMRIVYGVTQPDAGHVEWRGTPTVIDGPALARRLGIGMVFQHLALFETLTVAENIALEIEERTPAAVLAQRIVEVSARFGPPIDPRRLPHSMSMGERQRAALVRCLLQRPKLLILDEPTSILTPEAIESLFATLRGLAREGLGILFISHKLDEVRALCDTATVLRHGRVTARVVPKKESSASLARLMLGHDLGSYPLEPRTPGSPALELVDLDCPGDEPFGVSLRALRLSVRAGEIVGIAGISGNGQRELERAISGELRSPPGALRVAGEDAGALGPAARRRLGLRVVPEERLGRGTVPAMSLAENCILTGAPFGLVRRGLLRRGAARACARAIIERFAVRCVGELAPAQSLSGGNLQKFVVGREISFGPRALLLAQPTAGVDVGAAEQIHQALYALRAAGAAVLVISEDLDELRAICDRLAVLAGGRLSATVPTSEIDTATLGRWMSGEFDAGV
jgi:simple sugar transport system ATP-binding protein